MTVLWCIFDTHLCMRYKVESLMRDHLLETTPHVRPLFKPYIYTHHNVCKLTHQRDHPSFKWTSYQVVGWCLILDSTVYV